ncbi:putative nucleic acid-binding protein [Medicago truncatula]|uniref:Putative nucleic acid-binding protein n=1 Tax=Medicago truncatula TaxID=3880 RepID=A0A396HI80_MEDTR|nr:putative nucleic acid-binding protein [Medicago truncatula]
MMKMKMKGKMDSNFDALCHVLLGREAWRIEMRTARLWTIHTFVKPDQINSVEMVLIDDKGGKIHVTVRKQLLYLFQHLLVKGKVYKIAYFSVAPSVGSYRSTLHPHKIVFQMNTKVLECENSLISPCGLTFSNISKICSHTDEYDYLFGEFLWPMCM